MGFRNFLAGVVVGVAGTIGLSLYLYIKDNDSIIFDFVANKKIMILILKRGNK